jgi:hypothetical protein
MLCNIAFLFKTKSKEIKTVDEFNKKLSPTILLIVKLQVLAGYNIIQPFLVG